MSIDTRDDVMSAIQRLDPCPEAVHWLRTTEGTPKELWARCERGDWLLWLAARAGVERRRIVLAAADCAEVAAPHWTPDMETACIWAIDAARRWTRGETDLDEVHAAAYAASTAAAYAAAAYSANAAADAARLAARKTCADIVRRHIQWPDVWVSLLTRAGRGAA